MKSKVLNRSMFRKAMDPENVGIMDGFKDAMDENLKKALTKGEMPEEDDDALEREDEDEEGESGEMIGRTPRSPEILMNTLRGDMRSTSARRKELADLVGEEAAMETPEEVLTLLQSKLGQGIASVPGQQNAGPAPGGATPPPLPPSGAGAPPSLAGGGLEALGQQMQAAGIAPQGPGIAPQGPEIAPQGPGAAPQGALPPLNMADGGEVSYARYAAGGEAKKKETSISSLIPDFDPERVKTSAKAYEQLFSSALGQDLERDRNLSKAKLMADIAARSFAFAGNQDIKGNPLTGSIAARAAGAFSDVPSLMVSTAAEQNAMGREARLAALQQALQDESTARTLGAKLAVAGMKGSRGKSDLFALYDGRTRTGTVEKIQDADGNSSYIDVATGQQISLGPNQNLFRLPTKPDEPAGAGGEGTAGADKMFGSGMEGRMLAMVVNNKNAFFNGELSPVEEDAFRASVAQLAQERRITDPETGLITTVPPPPFIKPIYDAIFGGSGPAITGGVPPSAAPSAREMLDGMPTSGGEESAAPAPTLMSDLVLATSGLNPITGRASNVAGLSEVMGNAEAGQALANVTIMGDRLNKFFEGERGRPAVAIWKDAKKRLDLLQDPSFFASMFASKDKINNLGYALDNALRVSIADNQRIADDETLNVKDRNKARVALREAENLREQVGYPAYAKGLENASSEVDSQGRPVTQEIPYSELMRGR